MQGVREEGPLCEAVPKEEGIIIGFEEEGGKKLVGVGLFMDMGCGVCIYWLRIL